MKNYPNTAAASLSGFMHAATRVSPSVSPWMGASADVLARPKTADRVTRPVAAAGTPKQARPPRGGPR